MYQQNRDRKQKKRKYLQTLRRLIKNLRISIGRGVNYIRFKIQLYRQNRIKKIINNLDGSRMRDDHSKFRETLEANASALLRKY